MEWFEIIFGVLELFLEFMIHIGGDVLAEKVAHHARAKRSKPPAKTLTAVCGILALGVALGLLSLLVFPALMIKPGWDRVANLLGTPILCGWIMSRIGQRRERKGLPLVRMDRFWYGFLLAFAIAATRLIFAE